MLRKAKMATDTLNADLEILRNYCVDGACDDPAEMAIEAHERVLAEIDRLRKIEGNYKALVASIPRLYAVKSCPLSWGEMEIEFYDALVAGGESDERARHLAGLAFP